MGVWTTVKTALGMTPPPSGPPTAPVSPAQPSRPEEEDRAAKAPSASVLVPVAVAVPVPAPDPVSRLLNADRFAFGPRATTVRRDSPVSDEVLNEGRYEWRTFKSELVNADRYEWRLPDVVNAAHYRWRERLTH